MSDRVFIALVLTVTAALTAAGCLAPVWLAEYAAGSVPAPAVEHVVRARLAESLIRAAHVAAGVEALEAHYHHLHTERSVRMQRAQHVPSLDRLARSVYGPSARVVRESTNGLDVYYTDPEGVLLGETFEEARLTLQSLRDDRRGVA